jgi:hypothetical protein
MELYIRVQNGQPVEHPILGDNFKEAYPHIDVNNLPSDFARFIRVAAPAIGIFEIYEGLTYELVGSVYTDVHHVRSMTEDEKTQEITARMAEPHPADWVFSDVTYTWQPIVTETVISGSEPNVIG